MQVFSGDLTRWLSDLQPPIWEIELRDGTRAEEDAIHVDASAHEPESMGDRQWVWDGLEIGDGSGALDVQMDLSEDGWRLQIQNSSDEYGIWRVLFPRVAIRVEPQARVVLPLGWGVEFGSNDLEPFHGDYPNGHCPMQWLFVHDGRAGIYVAAHDGEGYHKGIHAVPHDGVLSVEFAHLPENTGVPGQDFVLPYPCAIESIEGDWVSAAKRYRSWAKAEAIWFPRRRKHPRDLLAEQRDAPNWLRDTALWCLASGAPEDVVPSVKRFAEYFGVPTSVHWYNWHQIPFDTYYPEYFPTKDGFKEGVAELQAAGLHVMPYINARLFDASTESWKHDGAEKFCALGADGQPYAEVYGSSPPLTPMCPATEYWQDKVAGIVERLVGEYGVDGVYLDQIASAGVRPCFHPDHPHPPGDGGFWVRGYREMLHEIRERIRAIAPESLLTTEDAAEPYGGLLDAFLMCNRTRSEQIPAYTAVYAGTTLTFGRYLFAEDAKASLPFITKCAEQFIFGAQMGWLGPWILDYPAEAAYLKALAQVRHEANAFLALGEFVGLPVIRGAIPRLETVWKLWGREEEVVMSAVQSSAWHASDGRLGVVLTNAHKQTLRFTWTMPGTDLTVEEELPGRSAVLRVVLPE